MLIKMRAILLLTFTVGLTSGCDLLNDRPIGLGYSAKYICSYVFNSGFDEEYVIDRLVAPKVNPLPLLWRIEVDHSLKQVRVWDKLFGKKYGALAIYTQGKGCTLLVNKSLQEVTSIPFSPSEPATLDPNIPWPYGSGGMPDTPIPGLDYDRVNTAVATAFEETHALPINTTSIVVAYQGKLIAEGYGQEVDKDTLLLGWSMTKTITGMLAGILIDEGRMDLDASAPIPRWQGTDKADITTRHLLAMSGGLMVDENYGHLSDVTRMLYLESDQFDYALRQKQVYQPGEVFQYSTAEANRLAAAVQETVGGTQQAMYDFYQSRLFHPLGLDRAFIEFDASGNLVGGAYGFMKARDWARLGQFYLQRGNWNGQQLISAEFVDFATHPAPSSPIYGGQIWLNTDGNRWPNIPGDAYFFAGHQGQHIVVIPSLQLVVVRTGVTEDRDLVVDGIMAPLLDEVIASLPQ